MPIAKLLRRRDFVSTALALGTSSGPAMATKQRARIRSSAPIIVGQSASLTGPLSGVTAAYSDGARLRFSALEFDSQRRTRVQLLQLDDHGDPNQATANARRLIADGAISLFGFVGADVCLAASSVAETAKLPFFAPFAASDDVRSPSRLQTFMPRASVADEARKLMQHCATLGKTRIALVAEQSVYGQSAARDLQTARRELALPPFVASEIVPATPAAGKSIMSSVLEADPQAIIHASLLPATSVAIKYARRSRFTGLLCCFSAVGLDSFVATMASDAAGVVVSQAGPSLSRRSLAIVREYTQAADAAGASSTQEGLEGYLAATLLVQALERADVASPAGLGRSLLAASNLEIGGVQINLKGLPGQTLGTVEVVSLTANGRALR